MNWICFVAAEETFIQGPRHQLVDIRHTWGVFFNTLQQTFLQASFRGRKFRAFCPKIKTLNITRNPLFGHSFLSLALGAIISNKIFIVFCLFLCRFVFEWLQLFSNVISVVSNSIAPSFNLLHCCDCVPSLHKSFHFRAFAPSSWIPISQPNFWVKFACKEFVLIKTVKLVNLPSKYAIVLFHTI